MAGGWLRIRLIIRLSQPSLAGDGAGAELGKNIKAKFKVDQAEYLKNECIQQS